MIAEEIPVTRSPCTYVRPALRNKRRFEKELVSVPVTRYRRRRREAINRGGHFPEVIFLRVRACAELS